MTPLEIIIASLVILTVDYFVELYFRRTDFRNRIAVRQRSSHPLLRNTLYAAEAPNHRHT